MGRTPSHLYLEREHVPWYLKAATTVSTWFAVAGYTLFALIFTSAKDNLKTSRSVLTALASAFLVIGYAGAIAAFIFGRSILFRLDAIYLPYLLTSIAGLIEIVANHSLHKKFQSSKVYIFVPLIIASITTILFAALAFISWRRVGNIEAVGERTGAPLTKWEAQNSPHHTDPAAATELLAMDIPEDEAQRRQLLRLLLAREQERGPSPDASSTYRIDWMGDDGERPNRLTVPAYARSRRGSAPEITDKWSISNLLGRKKGAPAQNVDVTDTREQRRRQIERDSLTSSSIPALDREALRSYESSSTWAGRSNRESYA